jgi:DNA-binding response OmpR family regulator
MTQEPHAGRYIVLVTADSTFRHIVGNSLEAEGFPVHACGDELTARELLVSEPPAAVLIETELGGDISAFGLVEAIRRDPLTAHLPVVVCSPDERFLELHLLDLIHLGCDVLGLPYNFALLRSTLEQAMRRGPVLTPHVARMYAIDEVLSVV